MECAKCHTKVIYCPCCGERLTAADSYIQEDLAPTIMRPQIQQTQSGNKHKPNIQAQIPQNQQNLQKTINQQIAKLILLSGNTNEPEIFFLDQEVNLVGRPDLSKDSYPQIDLSFDKEGTISRYHAYVHNKDGRFFVEDLGSGNGTFLFDGDKLEKLVPRQLYPLQSRNRVRFGKVLMQFILE